MKQFLKKAFSLSAVYYTVGVIAFCAIMLITHTSESKLSLDPSRILYIYPFCLAFATANVIRKHTNMQLMARWLLHFVLTVIGAYLFIILPADLEASSGNFMGLMLILALYFVGAVFSAILSKRIKSAIREDAEIKKDLKTK